MHPKYQEAAEYNRLKSERIKQENREIKKKASKEIRPLSKYELKLISTALYWTEGGKKQLNRV